VTDGAEFQEGWLVREEDHGLLMRIGQALKSLAPLTRCGDDLIALGEAWDAIESIMNDCTINVDIGLSIGFRRAFRRGAIECEEGLFMCFRINDDEIVLDELNTAYSSDLGSDHSTTVYAALRPDAGLDAVGVEAWLGKLEEVKGFDDAQLSVERDHV
jgi:hypothetical protein